MLVLELCFGSEENWVISSNLGNYGNSTEEMSSEPFLVEEWGRVFIRGKERQKGEEERHGGRTVLGVGGSELSCDG